MDPGTSQDHIPFVELCHKEEDMWLHMAFDSHHSVSHLTDCSLPGVSFKCRYTDWAGLQPLQVAFSGVRWVNDPIGAAATIYHCSPRGEVLIAQRREFNEGVEQCAIHWEVVKLLPDPAILFHNLLGYFLRSLDATLSKDHQFFDSTSSTSASSKT